MRGKTRPDCKGKPTWNKGLKWSDEVKIKFSRAREGRKFSPHSEETKEKISAKQKGIPRPYARLNPQIFKKGHISNETSFKKGNEPWNKDNTGVYSQEWIDAMKERRMHLKIPFRDSTIEVVIQNELKKLGIEFTRKTFKIRDFYHEVDLFIEPNIVIECDGDHWHSRLLMGSNIFRIQRDFIIDAELEKIGTKVVRLWEYDIINNLEWCMKQIMDVLKGLNLSSDRYH